MSDTLHLYLNTFPCSLLPARLHTVRSGQLSLAGLAGARPGVGWAVVLLLTLGSLMVEGSLKPRAWLLNLMLTAGTRH